MAKEEVPLGYFIKSQYTLVYAHSEQLQLPIMQLTISFLGQFPFICHVFLETGQYRLVLMRFFLHYQAVSCAHMAVLSCISTVHPQCNSVHSLTYQMPALLWFLL